MSTITLGKNNKVNYSDLVPEITTGPNCDLAPAALK